MGYTEDIFSALDIQDELQTLYTSGTVFHAFLGEKLPDWKAAAALVRKIAENYRLPYYTMSPTYSVCTDHGYLSGEQYVCPVCGKRTEVYSRITGYYRPVQNWNDDKAQEFKDRKVYSLTISAEAPHAVKAGTAAQVNQEPKAPAAETAEENEHILLIGTHTCPNCEMTVRLLEEMKIPYEEIFADDEPEVAERYEIVSAPTLVVGGEGRKITGFGPIRKFVMNYAEHHIV